jgi:hypothetical protein
MFWRGLRCHSVQRKIRGLIGKWVLFWMAYVSGEVRRAISKSDLKGAAAAELKRAA